MQALFQPLAPDGSLLSSLSIEQETLCRRMLHFLHDVRPVGYVSYFLNPNSHPRYNHFTLIRNTVGGIGFKDIAYAREMTPFFFVPASYLDSPDSWEAQICELMRSDREKAVEDVLKYFGDVSPDEFTFDVTREKIEESDTVNLIVRIHPGMKTPSSPKLRKLLAGKGVLAVPSLKFAV